MIDAARQHVGHDGFERFSRCFNRDKHTRLQLFQFGTPADALKDMATHVQGHTPTREAATLDEGTLSSPRTKAVTPRRVSRALKYFRDTSPPEADRRYSKSCHDARLALKALRMVFCGNPVCLANARTTCVFAMSPVRFNARVITFGPSCPKLPNRLSNCLRPDTSISPTRTCHAPCKTWQPADNKAV
jgi:hypothetical protein